MVVLFGSGVGACVVTDGRRSRAAPSSGATSRCASGADGAGAGRWAAWRRTRGRRRCSNGGRRRAGGRPGAPTRRRALTALLGAAYPEGDRAADPTALAVLEETAEYLGAGLSDLINLFQPERILVGGWAGLQLGQRFLTAVERHIPTYALAYPAARVTIGLGRLGPDAVTVGAATLPLADFFTRGGRRAAPTPEAAAPAWQTALEGRTPK